MTNCIDNFLKQIRCAWLAKAAWVILGTATVLASSLFLGRVISVFAELLGLSDRGGAVLIWILSTIVILLTFLIHYINHNDNKHKHGYDD